MAELPEPMLSFGAGCPDVGERHVSLPPELPVVGDDFDWNVRDYDGFRMFMLEELAARFPERRRWTPADLETVLVEAFSTVLDQLSDMADRVAAEASLETASRPDSVYRLLKLIGYDAVLESGLLDDDTSDYPTALETLKSTWTEQPEKMESARALGPMNIHRQRRMVTVKDYARMLEEHPVVLRASAVERWEGSWMTLRVTVHLWKDSNLEDACDPELAEKIKIFHRRNGLYEPGFDGDTPPTYRSVLKLYIDKYRMTGQEVWLQNPIRVGLVLSVSITIRDQYFQSEIRREVEHVLGSSPGAFFEPGRLSFGQDLSIGDIYQTILKIEGVENVCVNHFKRYGPQYSSINDIIKVEDLELIVCDNQPEKPWLGYYDLSITGGRRG